MDRLILLTLALLAVFLPAWPTMGERVFNDLLGQMLSVYLLPALGMLLAMRCGAIDLSVWASMALGGAVAAAAINALSGGDPQAAAHAAHWGLLAGAGAGLLVGGLNALLVARVGIPSPVATFVVAGALTAGMCLSGPERIAIPDTAFAHWHLEQAVGPPDGDANAQMPAPYRVIAPLIVTRMLLVLCAYAVVTVILLARGSGRARPQAGPSRLPAMALAASGLLSGLGGAAWLIEQPSTPLHDVPIGTLRIPVAAVLAGGLALSGPGRTLLACLLLPAALGVAVAWRQHVTGLIDTWDGSWMVLLALAVLAQLGRARSGASSAPPPIPPADGHGGGRGRKWITMPAVLAMALLAFSGRVSELPVLRGAFDAPHLAQAQQALRIAAAALAALSAALLVRKLSTARKSSP